MSELIDIVAPPAFSVLVFERTAGGLLLAHGEPAVDDALAAVVVLRPAEAA